MNLCSIPDCGRKRYGNGYCKNHNRRWRRHGDPLAFVVEKRPFGLAQSYLENEVMTYEGDDCLVWPFEPGRARIRYKGKRWHVARLVCQLAHGAPPTPAHHAAHECGKGHLSCVAQRHLSWKTPKENSVDQIVHGTRVAGEKVNTAKLTRDEVDQIRSLKGHVRMSEIAKRFGITTRHAQDLGNGKHWQNHQLYILAILTFAGTLLAGFIL